MIAEPMELQTRIFVILLGVIVALFVINQVRTRKIKEQYAPNAVRLRGAELAAGLPGVRRVEHEAPYAVAFLEDGVTPSSFLRQLVEAGADVTHFEVVTPPLEDIFIEVVGRERQA